MQLFMVQWRRKYCAPSLVFISPLLWFWVDRQWHPAPVLLPGKSHGWRSLEGCSPWGRWGLGMTERLNFHFSLSCIGDNGNPLQYSCLEYPRDRGAWWAAIYGVAQSRTRLRQLSSSSRGLFKKIRDTKGTFHAKMDTIKDRNGMDLTEAEDIKKRWQEYTELYKEDLHDPDNHNGVITHLEPDILECKVKWALGSITMSKLSGSDGILVELFQILKYDAGKVLLSICQQIWKTQQWPQEWKRSVFIPNPKKGSAKKMFKLLCNCSHLTC